MKNILFSLAILITLFVYSSNYSRDSRSGNLQDGMYLVIDEIDKDTEPPALSNVNYTIVNCSTLLIENNDNKFRKVIIDTSDFVPLILKFKPQIEQMTEDKKKISIELTPAASEKLKQFSAANVKKRVGLIIGGEVISMHQIKTPLTSGLLQISYCGPDMCEILESRLLNNVDTTVVK